MRVLSLLWQCSCREPSVGTSAVPLVAKEGPPGHGLSHQFFLVDHPKHAKKANCLAGMVAPQCVGSFVLLLHLQASWSDLRRPTKERCHLLIKC